MRTQSNRRSFLSSLPAFMVLPKIVKDSDNSFLGNHPIACSNYDWVTFYNRQNKKWGENWDTCLADLAKTGIKAFEPSLTSVSEAKTIWKALSKHQISMPSVYVNSLLHSEAEAEKSIAQILAIADTVSKFGTRIFVTNPTPLKWGSNLLKSDAELIVQAQNLEKLGRELKKRKIALAYHTHDVELSAGAREFHHMMQNTTRDHVWFCMDVHWIYRGSMDSQVAVFDVLKMYGNRLLVLHLRQSVNSIWSETFGKGDIDYPRFARELKKMKISPHLVIEQCIETKTGGNLYGVEAHKIDLQAVKELFNV